MRTFTVSHFPLFSVRKTVVSFFAFYFLLGDRIVLKQNKIQVAFVHNTKRFPFIL
jgi:hypothetical protein